MNLFDDITEDTPQTLDESIFGYTPTIPYHSIAIPALPIGHPDFVYYDSTDVDVTRTWRRFGWTPIQRDAA